MGKVLRLQLQNLLGILDVEWNEESNTIQMAMAALHVLFLCSMLAMHRPCKVMRAPYFCVHYSKTQVEPVRFPNDVLKIV